MRRSASIGSLLRVRSDKTHVEHDEIRSYPSEGNYKALEFFYKTIERDPAYAQAYALASRCYGSRSIVSGLTTEERHEGERLARKAARLGKDDALSLCWAGFTLAMLTGAFDEGISLIDRSLELNSNLARAWSLSGWVRGWLDQPDVAIEHLARAMRLSPRDLQFHTMEHGMANAHLRAGRYEEALRWVEKSLRRQPRDPVARLTLVLIKAAAGDTEGARSAMQRLLQANPKLRISTAVSLPIFSPERRAWMADLLRKAGMPK